MNNKALSTVKKYNMISYGDRILAGVSGGADSVAMLYFLISIKDEYNLTLSVAHIEHGIRGQESVDDAEFVKKICDDNNIDFYLMSIDALNESRSARMSVEEYSRKKRYEFFSTIECDKIATAHNLTDNIETILFRLSRGTGLKGICGIPPVRDKIIRPFIELTSQEIRNYCKEQNIEYKIDSTNSENDYSRNYIRNVILNDFSNLSDNFEKVMSRFISNINEDYSFIDSCTSSAYSQCLVDNKLSIDKLKSYDKPIIKRVLVRYFDLQLDEYHLLEIMKLIDKSGKIQIRNNIFAISDGKFIRRADFCDRCDEFKYDLEILNIFEFNKNNVDFYCDYDKIIGNVYLRHRIAGDTISLAGRGCSKTLKKLFNEYKIPLENRENTAIIADDLGVIGVAGICVDERVKPDKSTQNIISIKLHSED